MMVAESNARKESVQGETMRMTQVLAGYAHAHGCRFVLGGREVEATHLFDDGQLMPIVSMHAQVKAMRLLDNDLACRVDEDPQGLLKVRAHVPNLAFGKLSDLVRGLFFVQAAETIFGISRGGVIDCTPVVEFFEMSLTERSQHLPEVVWPLAKPVTQ